MEIDLSRLYSGVDEFVDINKEIFIDSSYYKDTEIVSLPKVIVSGSVSLDSSNNIDCNLLVKGEMILNDSISLEEVSYPFECEINEKIDKNDKKIENTLDIIPILWENIVLEVPLKFTNVNDYSKFSGDGWKIISEEELVRKNNPFNDLDLGEE